MERGRDREDQKKKAGEDGKDDAAETHRPVWEDMTGCPARGAQGTKQVHGRRRPSGQTNGMDSGGTDGLTSCSFVSALIKTSFTGRIPKKWD